MTCVFDPPGSNGPWASKQKNYIKLGSADLFSEFCERRVVLGTARCSSPEG